MRVPWPVILASASPRRQELLKEIVSDFKVEVADVDETPLAGENPWETAKRLARLKATVAYQRHPDCLVIGGDTIVILPSDDFIQLAKPLDEDDAFRMLRMLSGEEHFVITGVCLKSPQFEQVFTASTAVTFRELSDEEIGKYVATGEPMDKAGAYAIQGGAKEFVSKYEGSLSNVIGLPVEAIQEKLSSLLDS